MRSGERWLRRIAIVSGSLALVAGLTLVASAFVHVRARAVTRSTPGAGGELGWLSRQVAIGDGNITYFAGGALSLSTMPTRSPYAGVRTGLWFAAPGGVTAPGWPSVSGMPMFEGSGYWRCPLWLIAAPAAASAATMWCLADRVRRARVEGRCLSCGYDLRATPERCPECGRAVAARLPPASARPARDVSERADGHDLGRR